MLAVERTLNGLGEGVSGKIGSQHPRPSDGLQKGPVQTHEAGQRQGR